MIMFAKFNVLSQYLGEHTGTTAIHTWYQVLKYRQM